MAGQTQDLPAERKNQPCVKAINPVPLACRSARQRTPKPAATERVSARKLRAENSRPRAGLAVCGASNRCRRQPRRLFADERASFFQELLAKSCRRDLAFTVDPASSSGSKLWLQNSGGGPPHSGTLREIGGAWQRRWRGGVRQAEAGFRARKRRGEHPVDNCRQLLRARGRAGQAAVRA